MSSFAIFPGCLIQARLPFLEKQTLNVLDALGQKVRYLKDSTCCADPIAARSLSQDAWAAVAARNLALAEEQGSDILTLCNGCFATLNEVNVRMKTSKKFGASVNKHLEEIGHSYCGGVTVWHISPFLEKVVGKEKVKALLANPLKGLRIAGHHGCHLTRPSQFAKTDDPINPVILDRLASWVGATPAAYTEAEMCCGSGIAPVEESAGKAMLAKLLETIETSGATHILTSCPTCWTRMDLEQKDILKRTVPVLYITELFALAFGLSTWDEVLKYHRTK